MRGEFGDLGEEAAIVADEIEAGEDDGDENTGEEEIELALNAIVNIRNAECGTFFGFVVLDEEAGDGGAEGGLAGLERVADLLGSGGFETGLRKREHAIDGVPELGEGLIEIEKLVVGGSDLGESRFVVDGILEVGANAFELRNPGEDWIGLRGILHVTHGEAEGVEVVLDAKELKGVTAVTVDEVALHFVDDGELEGDVGGVRENGEDCDCEAEV